jgi:hypothetical protein
VIQLLGVVEREVYLKVFTLSNHLDLTITVANNILQKVRPTILLTISHNLKRLLVHANNRPDWELIPKRCSKQNTWKRMLGHNIFLN